MTQATHRRVDINRWKSRYLNNRNWLFIWKMCECKIGYQRLAELSGISATTISRLITHPGSVPDEDTMKKICTVLKANPQDLGWAKRSAPFGTPFRIDVSILKEMLDFYVKGLIHVTGQLQAMSDKVDTMYMDYIDQLKDQDKLCVITEDRQNPFLATNQVLSEIIGENPDINDWDTPCQDHPPQL